MEDLIQFGVLLVLAYFWGGYVEKKHYKSLAEREARLPPVPVIIFDRHNFPHEVESVQMISANVVIGADYFKTVLAGLVNFFGGNVSVLESVLERGRREAVIRLKEQALQADFIANLRYETSEVSKNSRTEAPKIENYAYATAIYLKKNAVPAHAI